MNDTLKQNSKNENLDEIRHKERTMNISIAEGSFGVLSSNLGDNYIVPFALSLGSTAFQVGVLYSCIGLISPIGQIFGSRKIESKSRKSVLLQGILGQAAMWPLFLIIAVLYINQLLINFLSWILIGVFLLYSFSGGFMTPPWFSMMGDIVPENKRGRYFAKRNLITTGIALSGTLIFSFSLDWFNNNNAVIIGFILIFLIGFSTRILSFLLFTQHYYPPIQFEDSHHVSLIRFIKEIPHHNFGKFTLFVSLITFSQWIAGPFFSVYMLEELKFNYITFIFINIFPSIIALTIFPLLGRFSDYFGNVRLLRLGAIILPSLPLMWLFTAGPIEILLFPQLFSGIGWTAFNLAASNFIYDNISREKRGIYLAMYNLLLGFGIILGGLTGSILIQMIPYNLINPYLFVFFISGITRFLCVIFLLSKIKEIRISETKPILNLKNRNIYQWLFDTSLRVERKKKLRIKRNNST
ncbi:MAG: MFS transporter [Promethearchaeota archaeon]